jgi:hypothetical protein
MPIPAPVFPLLLPTFHNTSSVAVPPGEITFGVTSATAHEQLFITSSTSTGSGCVFVRVNVCRSSLNWSTSPKSFTGVSMVKSGVGGTTGLGGGRNPAYSRASEPSRHNTPTAYRMDRLPHGGRWWPVKVGERVRVDGGHASCFGYFGRPCR